MTLSRVEREIDRLFQLLNKHGVWLIIVLLVAFFTLSWAADPDLFARLAVGRLIQDSSAVPTVDQFAFTAKKPIWIDHEWLSGVIFYWVYSIGGAKGLWVLRALLVGLTVLLLSKAQAINDSTGRHKNLLLLLVSFQSIYLWVLLLRSQIFTYLFLAYLLFAMAAYLRKVSSWPLLIFPLVMAIWANCHGGFVVGLGLLGIFTVSLLVHSARLSALPALVLILSVLATGVNPYGFIPYWEFILEAIGKSRPNIDEWGRLSLVSGEAFLFEVILILIIWGAVRKRSLLGLTESALLIPSLCYGLLHYRLQAIFLFVAAAFASALFSEGIAGVSEILSGRAIVVRRAATIVVSFLILLSGSLAVRMILRWGLVDLDLRSYPTDAVTYLKDRGAGGTVLVDFNAGSFLIWNLWPKYTVSLDGRYEELYPDSTVQLVVDGLNPKSPRHHEALVSINPTYILASKTEAKYFADWVEVFRGETASVLTRSAS